MHYLYTIISAESDYRFTPLKSLFLYFDHILSLIYHFLKKNLQACLYYHILFNLKNLRRTGTPKHT